MEKTLTLAELQTLTDVLTGIYQEAKAEGNDLIVDYTKQALDVLAAD